MTIAPKTQPTVSVIPALYSVLAIERLAGKGSIPIAVLLVDVAEDKLYIRFRDDLADVADAEALDVLDGMADAIMARARDEGAVRLFGWFLDTLSGYVRLEEPRALPAPVNWLEAADRLFNDNVVKRLQQ
jgi:hypothetical protein